MGMVLINRKLIAYTDKIKRIGNKKWNLDL